MVKFKKQAFSFRFDKILSISSNDGCVCDIGHDTNLQLLIRATAPTNNDLDLISLIYTIEFLLEASHSEVEKDVTEAVFLTRWRSS